MRTASCPSCGAPVAFRGATSIVAVCSHCASQLVRDGVALADVGKVAQLLDDDSPLQLGASGSWRAVGFGVVGRIQYRYAAGVWNEWHLVFDNGRSGWLSDDMGTYVIEFLQPPAQVPAQATLTVGMRVTLGSHAFEVVELAQAALISFEGELPVRVQPGPVQTVDLRDPEGRFATLDYSEAGKPPLVYIGSGVELKDLRLTGLRDLTATGGGAVAAGRAAPNASAQSLACPGCGAPLTRKLAKTEAIACGSCGAVVDVTDPRYQIISRNDAALAKLPTTIPLGARGRLQGTTYEVVGAMRRSMQSEGRRYPWTEYLLHSAELGYRFLTEENGHFQIEKLTNSSLKIIDGPVRGDQVQSRLDYLNRSFLHFSSYQARVDAVIGEFFWRVRVGDAAAVDEFVAPPLMLTKETTPTESTWSFGEYLDPAKLWTAFALKGQPPIARGIAANQPLQLEALVRPMWLNFAIFAGIATLIHLVAGTLVDGRTLLRESIPGGPVGAEHRVRTSEFDVPGSRATPLTVRSTFGVYNAWVGLDYNLVNASTGANYSFGREVGFYSDGPGDDEPEGSQTGEVRVAQIPPGRYFLEISIEGDPTQASIVPGSVEVMRAAPSSFNLLLTIGGLVFFPFVVWWIRASFEKRRWSDSDHAASGSDDDDDDDDDN